MFKRFRSVSMLLFLGGISVGVAHATPSMLEANVVQQSNVCKGVVKDAQGETIIGASVVVKGTTNGTITGFMVTLLWKVPRRAISLKSLSSDMFLRK